VNKATVIRDPLHAMLAHIVVDTLGLDAAQALTLTPVTPLLGGRLGLNELDVLEVGARVEEQFEVSLSSGSGWQDALTNIAGLASFIRRQAPISVTISLPALDVEFDEDELQLRDRFRV
jgi:hypothetical protein